MSNQSSSASARLRPRSRLPVPSGSGVGAVFNLGKTNKVNATSSLTGSTKHSMPSVTNKGGGTALSLQVAKGKPPFSVNSSARVSKLNAGLLDGLAVTDLVRGGGQSRSFGFSMSTALNTTEKLLQIPGFGKLSAFCSSNSGGVASVTFTPGSQTIDMFTASLTSNQVISLRSLQLTPDTPITLTELSNSAINSQWLQPTFRYTTGSGDSALTFIATVDIIAEVAGPNCDFDASAITGPGITGP